MTSWFSPFDLQTSATPMAISRVRHDLFTTGMFLGTIPGFWASALFCCYWDLAGCCFAEESLRYTVAYIGTVALMAAIFNGVIRLSDATVSHTWRRTYAWSALHGYRYGDKPYVNQGHLIFGGCGSYNGDQILRRISRRLLRDSGHERLRTLMIWFAKDLREGEVNA